MIEIKHKKKDLLFIHIPKTGGTSILDKIDQSMWKKTMFYGHDPLFCIEKNNDIKNVFSFCVVRNPYERTFSYYNHFKKINNLNCSFLQFLNIIKIKKFFPNTPMIVFPQSFYVYDLNGSISIDKIYKYEKFYEIENDLGLKFKILNKGNYLKKDYKKAYENKDCVNLVQHLFSVDFINFNYNLNEL